MKYFTRAAIAAAVLATAGIVQAQSTTTPSPSDPARTTAPQDVTPGSAQRTPSGAMSTQESESMRAQVPSDRTTRSPSTAADSAATQPPARQPEAPGTVSPRAPATGAATTRPDTTGSMSDRSTRSGTAMDSGDTVARAPRSDRN